MAGLSPPEEPSGPRSSSLDFKLNGVQITSTDVKKLSEVHHPFQIEFPTELQELKVVVCKESRGPIKTASLEPGANLYIIVQKGAIDIDDTCENSFELDEQLYLRVPCRELRVKQDSGQARELLLWRRCRAPRHLFQSLGDPNSQENEPTKAPAVQQLTPIAVGVLSCPVHDLIVLTKVIPRAVCLRNKTGKDRYEVFKAHFRSCVEVIVSAVDHIAAALSIPNPKGILTIRELCSLLEKEDMNFLKRFKARMFDWTHKDQEEAHASSFHTNCKAVRKHTSNVLLAALEKCRFNSLTTKEFVGNGLQLLIDPTELVERLRAELLDREARANPVQKVFHFKRLLNVFACVAHHPFAELTYRDFVLLAEHWQALCDVCCSAEEERSSVVSYHPELSLAVVPYHPELSLAVYICSHEAPVSSCAAIFQVFHTWVGGNPCASFHAHELLEKLRDACVQLLESVHRVYTMKQQSEDPDILCKALAQLLMPLSEREETQGPQRSVHVTSCFKVAVLTAHGRVNSMEIMKTAIMKECIDMLWKGDSMLVNHLGKIPHMLKLQSMKQGTRPFMNAIDMGLRLLEELSREDIMMATPRGRCLFRVGLEIGFLVVYQLFVTFYLNANISWAELTILGWVCANLLESIQWMTFKIQSTLGRLTRVGWAFYNTLVNLLVLGAILVLLLWQNMVVPSSLYIMDGIVTTPAGVFAEGSYVPPNPMWVHISFALLTILVWIRMIGVIIPLFDDLGPLIDTVAIMTGALASFAVPLMCTLVAFATAMTILYGGQIAEYSYVLESMLQMLQGLLGNPDFRPLQSANDVLVDAMAIMGYVIMVLFLIVATIILMNLLIAVMSNRYKPDNVKGTSVLHKAHMVEYFNIEVENCFICPPFNVAQLALWVLPSDTYQSLKKTGLSTQSYGKWRAWIMRLFRKQVKKQSETGNDADQKTTSDDGVAVHLLVSRYTGYKAFPSLVMHLVVSPIVMVITWVLAILGIIAGGFYLIYLHLGHDTRHMYTWSTWFQSCKVSPDDAMAANGHPMSEVDGTNPPTLRKTNVSCMDKNRVLLPLALLGASVGMCVLWPLYILVAACFLVTIICVSITEWIGRILWDLYSIFLGGLVQIIVRCRRPNKNKAVIELRWQQAAKQAQISLLPPCVARAVAKPLAVGDEGKLIECVETTKSRVSADKDEDLPATIHLINELVDELGLRASDPRHPLSKSTKTAANVEELIDKKMKEMEERLVAAMGEQMKMLLNQLNRSNVPCSSTINVNQAPAPAQLPPVRESFRKARSPPNNHIDGGSGKQATKAKATEQHKKSFVHTPP